MHMDNPVGFANILISDLMPDEHLDISIQPQEQRETDFENEFLEDMQQMSEDQQIDLAMVLNAEANQNWDEGEGIQKIKI